VTAALSWYARNRREKLGLPMSATTAEVMAATKALNSGKPVKCRGRPPGVSNGANGHPRGADERDEQQASKALMTIATFYIGDVGQKERDENVRAIVMRFVQRRAK